MKAGWRITALGQVSTINYGYTESACSEPVGPRFLRITDIQDDHVDWDNVPYCRIEEIDQPKYRLASGDIVFARTGATTGKSFLVKEPPDAVFASYLIRLRLVDKELLPEFVALFFQSADYWKAIKDGSSGSAQGGFNATKLAALLLSVPPLAEQRRIVGVLTEAFACVATAKANAEKNFQNARSLFESILDFAIQGRLSAQDLAGESVDRLLNRIEQARTAAKHRRTDRTGSISFGPEPLPFKAPDNWKWAPLDELTIGISDGVHSKPTYVEKGIPFVTVKNLTSGPGISFDDTRYITPQDHEQFIMRTNPERGDILITKDGTIGVVRAVETDVAFSIFVSVALIKPALKDLTPYLTYALQATCVQNQIVPRGAALKHLYLVDLRRLAIPLPPYLEQVRISKRLDSIKEEIQRLEDTYQRKLGALDEMKKSLLNQAFTGQL
jgi:type I restriction enzyme S subunit